MCHICDNKPGIIVLANYADLTYTERAEATEETKREIVLTLIYAFKYLVTMNFIIQLFNL